ncbi:hypothetical protein ILUMI_27336 [Ignelater luminosus]|uniref:HTH CENPB-type domain-containing protein n=1 Tax=Ignelater luminosus TaxID=2038154 RepID=A0A8K0FY24_IGNLU|nr:hypothetical protein ILUMI_27336 [Ignelater luminosus]
MKLGYELAKRNSLKYPLPQDQNEQAGEDWLSYFLSRHPCLSISTPDATSLGNIFTDDDFLSSSVTGRPMHEDNVTTNSNANTIHNLIGTDVNLEEPSTFKCHLIHKTPEKSKFSSQGEAF